MNFTVKEQIKVIMDRKKVSITQLAEIMGQSKQNLSKKLLRDNFSVYELQEIAKALDVEFKAYFVIPDNPKI